MFSSAIFARSATSLGVVSTSSTGSSVFLKLCSSLTRVEVLSCLLQVSILVRLPLAFSVDPVVFEFVELFLDGSGGVVGCMYDSVSSVKCSFVAAEVMEVRVAVEAESFGCWVSCLTRLPNGKQICGGGDMMEEKNEREECEVEKRTSK